MAYHVEGNLLYANGSPVSFQSTPNVGGTVKPRYLVLHYTAGTSGSGAVEWLRNPKARASAHFVIDRDGGVTQLVELDRVAWHAGKSAWQGVQGLNHYSIGIELVNAGKLHQNAAGTWINWANKAIPPDEVIVAVHKAETAPAGWQVYPAGQLEVVIAIGLALHEAFGFDDVLGHDDIAPGRKVDPGPAFPMISVQSQILGRVAA